jgi:hypothetical protein
MKILILMIVLVSQSVYASEIIKLGKDVSFNHTTHATANKCNACHILRVGKIDGIGKNYAHKECKGCHAKTSGPTMCKGCHTKI